MFGKPNSVTLLTKAQKAEAVADKALATAQKARAIATQQRILASRMEAEENAVRLETEAITAKMVTVKAAETCQLTAKEQHTAEAVLQAAEQNTEQARRFYDQCDSESDIAVNAAKSARVKVPATETEHTS